MSNLEVNGQLEVLATYLRPNGCTGRTALDFESDEPVTYQHLSQYITHYQRSFLSRVVPLCLVVPCRLGTFLGTAEKLSEYSNLLSALFDFIWNISILS